MSKVAVVYWSGTGNTAEMATAVAEGAKEKGAEVSLMFCGEFVLTMVDVAKEQGKTIDANKLSEKLGIPVVSLVAPDKRDYGVFYRAVEDSVDSPNHQ